MSSSTASRFISGFSHGVPSCASVVHFHDGSFTGLMYFILYPLSERRFATSARYSAKSS